MGIDLHNLQFLAHAQDLGVSFARTLAIGRQALFVDAPDLLAHQRLRGLPPLRQEAQAPVPAAGEPAYFEPLLRQWFAAEQADSVDASPYEQATFVHDMNLPWQRGDSAGSYDAVLDFGCLEHVFDFPAAWRNCVDQVRVGGHMLHALPANNLCGHGFYQFSPELFFNLYQAARGWELRAVYAALKAEPAAWWRVADPLAARRRVNLRNSHEVYLLVLARKLRDCGPLPAPQQSDYAQGEWQGGGVGTGTGAGAGVGAGAGAGAGAGTGADMRPRQPSRWQAPLAALGVLGAARRGRAWWQALHSSGLSLPAGDYTRVDVARLLAR